MVEMAEFMLTQRALTDALARITVLEEELAKAQADGSLRELIAGAMFAALVAYDQSRLTRDIVEQSRFLADSYMKICKGMQDADKG